MNKVFCSFENLFLSEKIGRKTNGNGLGYRVRNYKVRNVIMGLSSNSCVGNKIEIMFVKYFF